MYYFAQNSPISFLVISIVCSSTIANLLNPTSITTHLTTNSNVSGVEPLSANDSSTLQFIQETVNQNPIVIFSKTKCSPCDLAKNAFRNLGENYLEVNLDQRKDVNTMAMMLSRLTMSRSVPQVFLYGKYIGGGEQINKMKNSGELRRMIDSARQETWKNATLQQ